MGQTKKFMTDNDPMQTLQGAFNEVDFSFTQSGFLTGRIGRKIEVGGSGAVEIYTFKEDGITLYELTLTYTDSTKATLLSAERTA